MDEKGQSFAVFKLLIGAILAMMILIIIYGAISYLDTLKLIIDQQRFFATLKDATSQPNGRVIVAGNIYFNNTIYTRKTLSEQMGMDNADCIELDALTNEIFVLEDDYISIERKYSTNVYVKCEASGAYPAECGFGCFISFGKVID